MLVLRCPLHLVIPSEVEGSLRFFDSGCASAQNDTHNGQRDTTRVIPTKAEGRVNAVLSKSLIWVTAPMRKLSAL